jgi:hypothetical protein
MLEPGFGIRDSCTGTIYRAHAFPNPGSYLPPLSPRRVQIASVAFARFKV